MALHLGVRRNLIERDEALAARDRAEAEQATTMGELRAGQDSPGLSALLPFETLAERGRHSGAPINVVNPHVLATPTRLLALE